METTSTSTTTMKTTTPQEQELHYECKSSSPILRYNKTSSFVLPIRQRSTRSVHFAPLVNKSSEVDSKKVFAAPHTELTQDMIHQTWYSKEEIYLIQRGIKIMALLKAKFPNMDDNSFRDSMMGVDRFHPKRAAYKRAAMKFTLEAQEKSDDPTFLAVIAKQCSKWAKGAAFRFALQNYGEVYDPSTLDVLNSSCRKEQVEASTTIGTKRSSQGGAIMGFPSNKKQRLAKSA